MFIVAAILSLVCQVTFAGDIGTFWHYTDFHVDMEYNIRNNSDYWGEYVKDTSTIAAFTGIEYGNDMGYAENYPDFVLWTGDAAAHANASEERLLDSLRFLSRHMKLAFERPPIIPIIGNHDVFPVNVMSNKDEDVKRTEWCSFLGRDKSYWHEFVDRAISTMGDEFYTNFSETCSLAYLMLEPTKLMIIAVNSLIWYNNNPAIDESIEDPLALFQWIEDCLKFAKDGGYKAIIAMHVPPGVNEFAPTTYTNLKKAYNERFFNILVSYSNTIMTTVAGHEHIDAFRVILNGTYYPVGTLFLTPSVSPIFMKGIGAGNPRLRRFTYNRKTYEIMSYTQYILDISHPGPQWKPYYEANEQYKMADLSAENMADLLDKFTENDNPDGLWSTYWNNQLGGRPHDAPQISPDGTCPKARSVCRCEQICSIRHMNMKELEACLSVCHSGTKEPQLKTIKQLRGGQSRLHAALALLLLLYPLFY